MKDTSRTICTVLSFIIPLVGVTLYFTYNKKQDAKLFGIIGVIGIIVYVSIGIEFL